MTPAAPAAPERIDILDEFAVDGGEPVPIRLLGVDCDVRRQFTGAEAVKFYALAERVQIEELLSLITSDGPGLWEQVGQLTPEHAAKALNRIINLSELHKGELLAPLPWSALSSPTAGAQPSPESSTTTD
ncbi:hypothetical protein [Nocardia africana]|uniref:Tail assembly chaperone n=1 Tax=Nocardia africana TaxID=134964 RepID=A0A378X2F7_9NOCA|nr:hypothetical protein [Nocardia africana]MCC3311531.1 hypothetical protein [Nocardia africana]SUA47207.1 Uncharacterised protein [Nocardia africana]